MRRGEIDRLVWEQVDLANRHIWIKTTPYFRPKARNSENRIDAPSIVFEELARFKPLSITPPFVIPGSANLAQQVRCKPTFRRLTDWLHRQGIQKTNALHVLRKEAGSLIFQSSGSIDLAAEFLRNDPRVAREHYIGRKGRLQILIPGIDLG